MENGVQAAPRTSVTCSQSIENGSHPSEVQGILSLNTQQPFMFTVDEPVAGRTYPTLRR
ncbi:MAG: hypothetical protein K8I30_16410 [Anaerolineae bacterium]|nr:hypothetical protein [Anaerolineae bacterium]